MKPDTKWRLFGLLLFPLPFVVHFRDGNDLLLVATSIYPLFIHWIFRDEAFHRIGYWIEGVPNYSRDPLIFIFFGFGEFTSCSGGYQSDEYYKRYPWKRDFGIVAPPLGFLLSALIATLFLVLHAVDGVDLGNGLLVRWVIAEVAMNWLCILLNLIVRSEDYDKSSDFWRWVHDRRHLPPSVKRPRSIKDYAGDFSVISQSGRRIGLVGQTPPGSYAVRRAAWRIQATVSTPPRIGG
jgi:hypothetical protein